MNYFEYPAGRSVVWIYKINNNWKIYYFNVIDNDLSMWMVELAELTRSELTIAQLSQTE